MALDIANRWSDMVLLCSEILIISGEVVYNFKGGGGLYLSKKSSLEKISDPSKNNTNIEILPPFPIRKKERYSWL